MYEDQVIKKFLDLFCDSQGQKVSSEKTIIYFSKNVHNARRHEIDSALGFFRTTNLGRYLGVPLHHKRVIKSTFQFLLDKATQRLSGWNVNSLSLAGRVMLTHFMLAALPTYVM